jgi:hypothetical protein
MYYQIQKSGLKKYNLKGGKSKQTQLKEKSKRKEKKVSRYNSLVNTVLVQIFFIF